MTGRLPFSTERITGRADYDPRSGTLLLSVGKPMPRVEATVCVVTAGTMDTAVAEEARRLSVETDPFVLKAIEAMPNAKALLENAKKMITQRTRD